MSNHSNYATSKYCLNKKTVPLEFDEQVCLVDYLEIKGLLFSKTAQETFTRSWGQKMKNKQSGLRKGLPDIFIILPKDKTKCGMTLLACIEMKRIKGGVTSPEQQVWIDSLASVVGIVATVANGFDEAREFIDKYLK